MDYLYIAVKLITGMLGLIAITRLLGKKEMSQVTPLDFVYALVLGGIVEESIYDDATGLSDMFLALAVWGILIFAVEKITQKYDRLRHIVKGKPSLIIEDGKVNMEALKKNKLEIEELRELLRLNGVFSIREVNSAILENSGQLSVLRKAGEEPISRKEVKEHFPENKLSYLLVDEGVIDSGGLHQANKSEDWVKKQLQKLHYSVEDIEFAEWDPDSGFHVQVKER
jgi:uncharacterized membrane protein YcaP (DUF421 family)